MSNDFGVKIANTLQGLGNADPFYAADNRAGVDDNLECTQYVNDEIYAATGFNLAQAVGDDMDACESTWGSVVPWGTEDGGYVYPHAGSSSGSPVARSGSLLVENWQNFFERQGVWHPVEATACTADNPGGAPAGMQPGDVLLLREADGTTHAAMVECVDAQGHPTTIVESTGGGNANEAVKEKSWTDFQHDYQAQGFTLLGYGRPADLDPGILARNTQNPSLMTASWIEKSPHRWNG